uniref:Uncharacterized protein n=1 Tax=Sarcophilus harrisii TaxID=9305 RepID=A0A7N4V243_SARHA
TTSSTGLVFGKGTKLVVIP